MNKQRELGFLADYGCNLLALSETTATQQVQRIVNGQARQLGYATVWYSHEEPPSRALNASGAVQVAQQSWGKCQFDMVGTPLGMIW